MFKFPFVFETKHTVFSKRVSFTRTEALSTTFLKAMKMYNSRDTALSTTFSFTRTKITFMKMFVPPTNWELLYIVVLDRRRVKSKSIYSSRVVCFFLVE